jgi:hypothetical protein
MMTRKMAAAQRRITEARVLLIAEIDRIENASGLLKIGSMELAQAADACSRAIREIQYADQRMQR